MRQEEHRSRHKFKFSIEVELVGANVILIKAGFWVRGKCFRGKWLIFVFLLTSIFYIKKFLKWNGSIPSAMQVLMVVVN